ncbi:MAG: fumarylacetoacetate hydrolase family protein [Endozoicomonas sp.]
MKYRHRWISGDRIDLPSGKVVCVGRNYAAHVHELDNPLPDDPVLFIKPLTSIVNLDQPIVLPKKRGEVHHELEISLLIKETLKDASENEAISAIMAIGLGIDLTLRDLQSQQKAKGLPWEVAKAFDNSCPLSGFIAVEHVKDPEHLEFSLKVNDDVRQKGTTEHMLTSIPGLLSYISRHFTLMPGDIVLTGTPSGVGPLAAGDVLELSLHGTFTTEARCI